MADDAGTALDVAAELLAPFLPDATGFHRPREPEPEAPAPRVAAHRRALPLLVGTRASPLALLQVRLFMALVTRHCPALRGMAVFREQAIRTAGDASQASGIRLADLGGKGLFAKEIHEALLDRRIDLAVHSLKDLETELPPGIVLACTLPREDPREALILGPDCDGQGPGCDGDGPDRQGGEDPFAALPRGALVGSSSVRRQAQLLHARPDLRVATIRGNVQTRLDKVRHGTFAASLLALAGLRRLGLEEEAAAVIGPEHMLPAACQGIVGITVRESDAQLRELLGAVEDRPARIAATAERALLAALDGSCHTPVGGHARLLPGGRLRLDGLVARRDGSFLLRRSLEGAQADAARIGAALGAALRADAPRDVFA